MPTIRVLVTLVLAVVVALVPRPSAATPALDFVDGGASGVGRFTLTVGWAFTVNSPITVDALGLFDVDGDGLLESHQIGLWAGDGSLLGSTVITDANSTPAASTSSLGNWRFTSIAPLVLVAGEYVIGAVYAASTVNATNAIDAFVFGANATTVPEVTFGGNLFRQGIGFPNNSTNSNDGFFGPNLSVSAIAVAEPASLVLLGTGLAGLTGLAAWRVRRRR